VQQQVFSDTRFDQLDIPEIVLEGIREAGYEFCTPVQKEVLPRALKDEDIAAQSQTGTGKTATFLITLLTRLVESGNKKKDRRSSEGTAQPRALILAPTRELVVQIGREAEILARPAGIRFQTIYGGVDYDKQRRILVDDQADVIVATPGRLIDYQKQGVFSLQEIEVLAIDEADRMFDMGFIPDVRWLLRRCTPAEKRQSLLFSATLSAKVMELAYEHLNISEAVNINPEQITVDKIKQTLYHVGKDEKLALLFGILKREKPERSLIFTNTKRMAERLEGYLKANGYAAACLTGDVPQKKRQATLERFKDHKLNFLIATDVASRGLHIEAVTHVFNFDLPQDPEDYVHRIGRTARIGASGTAIALAGEEDAFYLEPIEKLIGYKIPVEWAEEKDFERDFKRPARRPESRSGDRDRGSSRGRSSRSGGRSDGRGRSGDRNSRTRSGERKPKGSDSGSSEQAAGGNRRRKRPNREQTPEKAAAGTGRKSPDSSKPADQKSGDQKSGQRRRRPRRKPGGDAAPPQSAPAKTTKPAPAKAPQSGKEQGGGKKKSGLLDRITGLLRGKK
jgi:ATP-dependent RNA helicase RhlB